METNYPWDGKVTLTCSPARKTRYGLHIRIPGWSQNTAVPGNLYSFLASQQSNIQVRLNGKPVNYATEKGYLVIDREWNKGDVIEFTMPMEVKRVVSRPEIKFNKDRVAIQRGPIVYCIEGADNNGKAWNLLIPDSSTFSASTQNVISEQVIALKADVPVLEVSTDGMNVSVTNRPVTAIPYYVWCNRGSNQMQVWLPRKISEIKL